MPIYVLRKKEHSRESRKTCRGGITRIHCGKTGAPEEFVRIAFQTYSCLEATRLAPPQCCFCWLTDIYAGRDTQDQAQNADRVLVTLFRETTSASAWKSSWRFLCRTSPQVKRWNIAPLRRSPVPRRGG